MTGEKKSMGKKEYERWKNMTNIQIPIFFNHWWKEYMFYHVQALLLQ